MPFTMKLEHWHKAVRTMRACFAIALDTRMKHGSVKAKVFSWTVLWKWKLMLKDPYGTFLEIWLIKRMVQWKISTSCQDEKCVTTFWMFGKNAGKFQYSVRSCQHWGNWKRENGKRETVEKWHWNTRNRQVLLNSTFNKNIWHILLVPLSLKLWIRHVATNVVMLYGLK